MTSSEKIPLPLLPTALREAGFEPPPYRACLNAAMDARIPVMRTVTGRWVVNRDDLPVIAVAMRLTRPSGPADPHSNRKQARPN